MPYIRECKAPDLTDLSLPVMADYFLNLIFHHACIKNHTASSFLKNFLMVADKALTEYNSGRELLINYVASENKTMLLMEAFGRFETCINSIRRCLRYVDKMPRHPCSPAIDRTLRRLLRSYESTITPLRDSIEHMDDYILSGETPLGIPHSLTITPDAKFLEIASNRLSFTDISAILRQLHRLATELSRYREQERLE